ncbi:hypothetical protein [Streptomyces sp. NPDC019224]|uniref:hypothetical protein n=1 Tax=Streptomyces sp. NPDC019224 TaxID=3154484 RepID=UPI0034100BB0
MAAVIAVLGSGTGVQAAQNRSTDFTSAPAGIEIMSNEAYVAKYGVERALAEHVPLPPGNTGSASPSAADPSIPWHHIYWSALDWKHNDIPTRRGNDDFGFKHACSKHNVCTKTVINTPYDGKADRGKGNRVECDAVITSGASVRMTTTSIAERGERGPNGQNTPDGRPIGTVTAFCRGQTMCPDWVNQL